jgi:hypothetical protein
MWQICFTHLKIAKFAFFIENVDIHNNNFGLGKEASHQRGRGHHSG